VRHWPAHLDSPVLAAALLAGCLGKKEGRPVAGTSASPKGSVWPKRQKTQARTSRRPFGDFWQTDHTYHDREYRPKAKTGIGDSYYKEGGMAWAWKQGDVEIIRTFIQFFPFLTKSIRSDADREWDIHRQMEKPDPRSYRVVQARGRRPNNSKISSKKYPEIVRYTASGAAPARSAGEVWQKELHAVLILYIRNATGSRGAMIELTNRLSGVQRRRKGQIGLLGQIYETGEQQRACGPEYTRGL